MNQLELQTVSDELANQQLRERSKKIQGILSQQILQRENRDFAGTSGISENNRALGFVPGYLNSQTGMICVSRFADGRPAPIHILDGLPNDWVALRNSCGRVLRTQNGIVSGFIRGGRFYTREQAAAKQKH